MQSSAVLRMIKIVGHGMKMLVGMPDYDIYVQHMQMRHPELPIMSYETFFRERLQARYVGDGKAGAMRCC